MTQQALHPEIEAIWKIESARLIATLTRMVRDISLAEDLAHDALVNALERWPAEGLPRNPAAWLIASAKNRAIDRLRRDRMLDRKHQELGIAAREKEMAMPELDSGQDDYKGDDLLRLIFTACHPVLPAESRVALTLRLVGGLTTTEIANAYLVPEPTIAQRIVRAKRTIAQQQIPFEVPVGADRDTRLASVLEVIYLIFNEGYAASAGEHVLRPALCNEALRLGRVLAELTPEEPEVHGLVALMELQASRSAARTDASGRPVLLLDQNRARWDQMLIRRGLSALARAQAAGSANGSYALQGAIAACHARARTPEETDWPRIAALYTELVSITGSPVVELNRAVAFGMAFGPAAGLELVDSLAAQPQLASYHWLPSVRADLLRKLGRIDDARREFERAASLARNVRDRELLREKAGECVRVQ